MNRLLEGIAFACSLYIAEGIEAQHKATAHDLRIPNFDRQLRHAFLCGAATEHMRRPEWLR